MNNFWLKLKKPFMVLAPMDDVTDNAFRKLINETARPDVFFTEFTSADGLTSAGKKRVIQKLKYEEGQRPIVAQIWGNNPINMEKSAKIVAQLGFDGIDINMGCPIRAVVRKHAGAGMIGDYKLTKDVIEATRSGAGDIPLSIKTRLGITTNIATEWCEFLLEQKIDALTVHARTAKQMSTGGANWDEIGRVVTLKNRVSPKTVIIGNGDIKSYSNAWEMYQKHHVDGIMIGRGIFSDPWVFSKNQQEHTREEYLTLLKKHLAYFIQENPDPEILKRRYPAMKKYFKIYITGFRGANDLRQRLLETNSPEEVMKLVPLQFGKESLYNILCPKL